MYYFFLCLFFLSLFLRLCVAILCLFLFLPQGIVFEDLSGTIILQPSQIALYTRQDHWILCHALDCLKLLFCFVVLLGLKVAYS